MMTRYTLKLGMALLFAGSLPCLAQLPAGAPTGATGQCKDGTFSMAANKGGACRGHQGVKTWYQTVGGPADPDIKGGSGPRSTSATKANSAGASTPAGAPVVSGSRAQAVNKKSGDTAVATPSDNGKTLAGPAANGGAMAMAPNPAAGGGSGKNSTGSMASNSMANKTAAPGGGPGMVWVNTGSNVYHCYGSQFYGKTKQGKYATEQQAMQMGAKADRGKACSK